MPAGLRPWVDDVSDRMQCPPDFVAVSVMAGIGSIIGRKVAIRPQSNNDWQIFPNQWALLIGRPGILKSPSMEEALRPLKRLAANAETIFKKAASEYEVRAKIAKLRADENTKKAAKALRGDPKSDISALLTAETLEEPTLRRYIANDTNVASLGVLLQQNPGNGFTSDHILLESLQPSAIQGQMAEGVIAKIQPCIEPNGQGVNALVDLS